MAKSKMKLPSIGLMVVGAGLVVWASQKSRGLESKLSNALTGSYSDNVMLLYIAGAVCIAAGVYLYKK